MTRLKMQIDFIKEIEKLKTVKRQNMTLDNYRQENSAEHSWHLAVMAFILVEQCDEDNLDVLTVIKMLLIHDLVEIYDGDTFLFDDDARIQAAKKERIAIEKLTAILPNNQAKEIIDLWEEFEKGVTTEAKYARSLDALQPVLNHLITAPENTNPHQLSAEKVLSKKQIIKVNTPKLWDVAVDAINQSVEKGLYLG